MKKILIILVISIFLFSCSKEYCRTKYPCIEKDSTSYIEKANIDTLYIPLSADTVKIQSDIDCPNQKIVYKDGKTEYKVVIKDKVLTVYRIAAKDSLRVIYAYKNTEEFKKLTEVKVVDKIVYKVPNWCYYCIGIIFILAAWITRKTWFKLLRFPI